MKLFSIGCEAHPVTEDEMREVNQEDLELLEFLSSAQVGEVLFDEGMNCLQVKRVA